MSIATEEQTVVDSIESTKTDRFDRPADDVVITSISVEDTDAPASA